MNQPEDRSGGDGVVAVIKQDDRFLLIQRAPDILCGGMWCFVGGGVHAGESQAAAVVREVREEVGLVVEPVAKVWEGRSPNGQWRLHGWTTSLLSATVTCNPDEVADHAWVTEADLRDWPGLLPSVLNVLGVL